MSTTVDQRVVEMQFDNRNFERNVQTSLSTLDKLKQSLNLNGVAKGLDSINTAASRCNMSGLNSAVESVQAKFSALQVMGVTALANITNSAVNAGKRITKALTIDPIKTGLQEYETQINAVQTILANTQSKGTTLNDVNAALDELNKYADQTIYNFTEMTRNIGTFTAAGVDLDKSVTSIKGIANLAAISGSTSQQASTAMYQLSQALAAGRVSLMDWNSVVNAGMGGEVFQNALKRTAKQMGINVDEMIKKYGSFRESLTKGEWLTAEVLTETLTQLSGAYSEADLIAQGYTEKQAKEIAELARTAVSAATDVKTFTQLVDTTKEALQSGWTQTWEILIGDFEEAKGLWSGVSKILNEFINASSEARNNLLEGWAKGGGRDMAIEAISNAFQGLLSVLKPIKEAFREVFPAVTSEQLIRITERIRDLTEKFKLSESQSEKLKSTFKGLFSIFKMGVDVVATIGGGLIKLFGAVTGIGNGVLTVTGSFGGWISKVSESVNVTDALAKGFEVAAKYIEKFVSFVGSKFAAPGYEGFLGIMKGLWDILSKIGGKIVEVGSSISESLVNVFRGGDISAGLDILNGGLFAAILLNIKNFVKNLSDPFESVGGVLEGAKDILDGVKGSLEAYQQSLKAGTLLKIAGAIAILAGSITVIAMIDPEKLAASLGAITVLFGELLGSMAIFNIIGGAYPGVIKAVTAMLGISTAVLILASALKKVGDLNIKETATGLVGITGLTAIVVGAAKVMATESKTVIKGAGQMILMAAALKILASVCEDMSKFSWTELGKGLVGMTGMMTGLVAAMKLLSGSKFGASTGASIILLASSMKIMASAVKDFATMKWAEIGRGLTAMAGALTATTVAMRLMPKNMVGTGAGLLVVSSALIVLSNALGKMGGMTWDEIGKGMATLGGSMLILAAGLRVMTGTLSGSASLLVAAGALAILTPVLKSLGGMSWGEIGKGLLTIAGAFAIIGVAGLVLTPVVPTILALSGSLALLGVACLAIGGGLSLIATGITALAVAGTAGATAIVASITTIVLGIAGLIPALAARFGEAIIVFCNVITEGAPAIGSAIKALVLSLVDVLVECVPAIANGAMKLIVGVLDALVEYSPQIIDLIFQFFINLLNGLGDRLPELIQATVNVLAQFFNGVIDALRGLDVSTLVTAIAGVGLISGLLLALGALSSLIPSAMVGVLGMGVLVAELALVLAAVGALAQIPGLSWLIGEGGTFLQIIGNAIGKFVGGIVGGFAEGVSSSFPQIAKDLSAFMTNLQPFIAGAKGLDASMADGVKALASTILVLTAADILEGITSWIAGGSSMSKFAEQLVPFGKALKSYSNEVTGIDTEAINGSAKAAKALTKVADAIPNSGGLAGIFAGENDMSSFADEMVSFGKALKRYSNAVVGIDSGAVNSSVKSAQTIVKFINSIGSLNTVGVGSFVSALNKLGQASVAKFVSAFTSSTSQLATAGGNMMEAVVKGIQAKQPLIATAVTTMMTNMVKTVDLTTVKFETIGDQMMIKFQAGATKGNQRVMKVMKSMLTSMINTIRNKRNEFYKAGSYLVDGFANGISANTYKAAAKARAMAKAAEDAAKKQLDEHSPSKVAHTIGEYFAIGFVQGIEKRLKDARNAGFKIGKSSQEGLETGLDGTEEAMFKRGEEIVNAIAIAYAKSLEARENYWKNLMAIRKKEQADREAEEKEIENYNEKLESSTKAMMEKNSLFSAVSSNSSLPADDKKKIKKTEELTINLKDQIKQLKRYNVVMTSLGKKLENTALGDAIKEMGVESIVELEAINSMTSKQLNEYVKLYDQKYKSAREAAVTQIEGLGHDLATSDNYELQQFQKEILESTKTILAEYTDELDRNTESLMNRSNIFNAVNEQEEVTSKQLIDNLDAQVDQMVLYTGVMANLQNKLGETSLWSTISEMGVESLAELSALDSMTSVQLDKYVDLFESKYKLAKEAAKFQLTDLREETEKKLSDLYGGAEVELNGFIAGFDETFESINTYVMKSQAIGDGMAAAMALGISNNADYVKEETVSAVTDAVDKGEKVAKAESPGIGYNFAIGVANSISANTYIPVEAAYSMGKKTAEALKAALDINSPSRVAYAIGGHFVQGFVNAINNCSATAKSASAGIAESAMKGLSTAAAKIAEFLESDIDSEPTIRPVLDLTNVESGAARLNTLFSRTQAMSISADMRRNKAVEVQNGETETPKAGNTYEFKQYNYSPKALSRLEIYRQTKNQFSALKGLVET